jgi:prepilin signal peptidase PulO-like enzyme (type II secretory pathway)
MYIFLLAVIVFVVGLAVGSFVNVVVMRMLRGEDWVRGRSHCDQCGRVLEWYELVPLLSFALLRGRCRTCQAEIDIMHPIVEFMTGSLFLWWLLIGFGLLRVGSAFFQLTAAPLQIVQPVYWLMVGIILLIIFFSDWRAQVIPDWTIVGLGILTMLYRCILIVLGAHQPGDFAWTLFGAMALMFGFLGLWLATKKRGIGFGDVKLIFVLSLLLNWPIMLVAALLSCILGAAYGLALMPFGKTRFGVPIAFGPFLVMGTVISLLWGEALLRWYIHLL